MIITRSLLFGFRPKEMLKVEKNAVMTAQDGKCTEIEYTI